jgi:hypothetical protein
MGNTESQQPGGAQKEAASSEMRTCYYEVLEVERADSTTSDDIKKVCLFSLLADSETRHTESWR